MAKDTFYFSHDYNSRSDEKIKLLIRKHGILGYGIFWAIVEDLYNNANALRTDSEGIAFDLRVDKNIVDSILNDFDLFVMKDDFFGSLSVERRLNDRNLKSVKARESANSRWLKAKEDANAMRQQCDSNAIKESKVKEKKVKEKKERKKDVVFDFSFVANNFSECFMKWIEYKKEINQSYKTQSGIKTCYEKLLLLSGGNPTKAMYVVNQSISNEWSGLFEYKGTVSETKQQIPDSEMTHLQLKTHLWENYIITQFELDGYSYDELMERYKSGIYEKKFRR